jgi:hypothetical protein
MTPDLFSDRSIWTMVHGIALGGGALLSLFAILFALRAMGPEAGGILPSSTQTRYLIALAVVAAILLWLTVLIGRYVTFPPYRATPPEGLVDLSRYPRSLIQSNDETRWLHSFGMEIKEHMPWIAAMLATAVAYIAVRYRSRLLTDRQLNAMASTLVTVSFLLVAFVSLLGVFINKVAPLE